MDNQNFQNEEQQNKNIPEPPPLEISVRTMEADVKNFYKGGGEVSSGAQIQKSNRQNERENDSYGGIPGYQGPEKSIFPKQVEILPEVSQQQSSGTGKTIAIIAGVLIVAAALGFLGYYVVFPLIFK